ERTDGNAVADTALQAIHHLFADPDFATRRAMVEYLRARKAIIGHLHQAIQRPAIINGLDADQQDFLVLDQHALETDIAAGVERFEQRQLCLIRRSTAVEFDVSTEQFGAAPVEA